MLKAQIQKIIQARPEYSNITTVIEKEILHHDIMDVLIQEGVMQALTFIGGTSLRMCYNSSRLSEDLDFNGGMGFKPEQFNGLDIAIQSYIQNKYQTEVWVNKPSEANQGDTSSWKISIIKEANRPDLPRQKMHIDVCAIPSFDIQKRPLINHYDIDVPTEGLLIPVQSLSETLADKLIALAYRARRIKPRDIWDILWIKQRGILISNDLVDKKLEVRAKNQVHFIDALTIQLNKLLHDLEVKEDFYQEMSRFIPSHIKSRTLDNPEYWEFVKTEVKTVCEQYTGDKTSSNFDMG